MTASAIDTALAHGRSDELRAINAYFDRLGGGAHHLLIEGEVGIGKTTLATYVCAAAAQRGFTVLSTFAVESEAEVGFTALTDLVEPIPPEVVAALPAPQRRALDAATARGDVEGGAVDSLAVRMALLSAIRLMAANAPVLLVVDDLSALDPSSRRVLTFALRRLEVEAAGMVGTLRTPFDSELPGLPVDGIPGRLERLHLAGLDFDASWDLLKNCPTPVLDRALARLVYRASGGNPFLLLRLAEDVARTGMPPAIDPTLPIPQSLRRLVETQLANVPDAWLDALLLCALAPEATVDIVRRASVNPDGVPEALAAAARAAIVDIRQGQVRFRHPLLRSIVADQPLAQTRRAAHRRLATAVVHPEERALHRALGASGPEEDVAAELEAAAMLASRRAACEAATQLAELAIALTPPGHAEASYRRTLAAAEYFFASGEPARARALAEQIRAGLAPGPARAAVAAQSTHYALYAGAPLDDLCVELEQAIQEAEGDLGVQLALRFSLGFMAAQQGEIKASRVQCREILRIAELTGNTSLLVLATSAMATMDYLCGDGVRPDIQALADAAMAGPVEGPTELSPRFSLGTVLKLSGRLHGARTLFEAELRRAVDRGDEPSRSTLLCHLSDIESWAGHLEESERLATSALQYARWSRSAPLEGMATCALGFVGAYRGDVAGARSCAATAAEIGTRNLRFLECQAHHLDGFVSLSVGDFGAAHRALLPWATQWGEQTMLQGGARAVPDAIEAAVRAGHVDLAAGVVQGLVEHAPALGRWAEAASGRCSALVLSATGDQVGAADAVDHALSIHAELAMPFDFARTLLVAGEVLRRVKRKADARHALQSAIETFDRLGTPLWADRARAELARVGIRASPSSAGVTSAQKQVSDLVVLGHSNKEIAAQLNMSVSAVEKHLSAVYDALGVRSRTQLIAKLARLAKMAENEDD